MRDCYIEHPDGPDVPFQDEIFWRKLSKSRWNIPVSFSVSKSEFKNSIKSMVTK